MELNCGIVSHFHVRGEPVHLTRVIRLHANKPPIPIPLTILKLCVGLPPDGGKFVELGHEEVHVPDARAQVRGAGHTRHARADGRTIVIGTMSLKCGFLVTGLVHPEWLEHPVLKELLIGHLHGLFQPPRQEDVVGVGIGVGAEGLVEDTLGTVLKIVHHVPSKLTHGEWVVNGCTETQQVIHRPPFYHVLVQCQVTRGPELQDEACRHRLGQGANLERVMKIHPVLEFKPRVS